MDNDLVLEQTENTPYVEAWCDLQLVCVGGNASMEDSSPIFNQINEWLEENMPEFVGNVSFEFNFQVISSSYSVSILKLIEKINNCTNDVINFSITWHCEVDSDVYHYGIKLKDASKCRFELLEHYKKFEYKNK